MFTTKEMIQALDRMQAAEQLPALVCIAIDVKNNLTGTAAGSLGDFSEEELPRVCYNFNEFIITEDDGKKKTAKKEAAFKKYMGRKFMKHFWKETDLGKKFRKKKFQKYFIRDFRVVPAEKIISTNGKDSEFKGKDALMITMGKK